MENRPETNNPTNNLESQGQVAAPVNVATPKQVLQKKVSIFSLTNNFRKQTSIEETDEQVAQSVTDAETELTAITKTLADLEDLIENTEKNIEKALADETLALNKISDAEKIIADLKTTAQTAINNAKIAETKTVNDATAAANTTEKAVQDAIEAAAKAAEDAAEKEAQAEGQKRIDLATAQKDKKINAAKAAAAEAELEAELEQTSAQEKNNPATEPERTIMRSASSFITLKAARNMMGVRTASVNVASGSKLEALQAKNAADIATLETTEKNKIEKIKEKNKKDIAQAKTNAGKAIRKNTDNVAKLNEAHRVCTQTIAQATQQAATARKTAEKGAETTRDTEVKAATAKLDQLKSEWTTAKKTRITSQLALKNATTQRTEATNQKAAIVQKLASLKAKSEEREALRTKKDPAPVDPAPEVKDPVVVVKEPTLATTTVHDTTANDKDDTVKKLATFFADIDDDHVEEEDKNIAIQTAKAPTSVAGNGAAPVVEADKGEPLNPGTGSTAQTDIATDEVTNTATAEKENSSFIFSTLLALEAKMRPIFKDGRAIFATLGLFLLAAGIVVALTYGVSACPLLALWVTPLAANQILGIAIAVGAISGISLGLGVYGMMARNNISLPKTSIYNWSLPKMSIFARKTPNDAKGVAPANDAAIEAKDDTSSAKSDSHTMGMGGSV